MADGRLRTIPVMETDAAEFARVARKVSWPQRDGDRPSQFWPAMSGFNIGAGSDVDISYLESTRTEPSNGFDRHLNTEELFVCLEGEYVMPMAPCRRPDDPDDEPQIEDLIGFRVRAGDAYVLRPNVWHNGGWPTRGAGKMRYIMVLSGHRAGEGHQGRVDHIMKTLPGGLQVIPAQLV